MRLMRQIAYGTVNTQFSHSHQARRVQTSAYRVGDFANDPCDMLYYMAGAAPVAGHRARGATQIPLYLFVWGRQHRLTADDISAVLRDISGTAW